MSRLVRGAVALVLGAALLGGAFARVPATRAAEQCFAETGFCVGPLFASYWQRNGGLAINGYPLSDERIERLEDGQLYTVQYFERARLEYHPENADQFHVLLGQFGRRIHGGADAPVGPSGDGTYYEETGHNVSGAFLAYWRGHGGLAQFGYPLTEQFSEQLEDGNTYQVQYFERARFELHPENQPPYDVLLGQFGRRVLAESSPANLAPCNANTLAVGTSGDAGAGSRFARIYLTNTGGTACTLAGAPQVQLQSVAGTPLDVNTTTEDNPPVGVMVLAPSLMAEFGVRWSNWCGADPGQATMQVTLPNGGGTFTTTGIGTPPCLGEGQASNVGVSPFSVEFTAGHANVVLRFYKAINAQDYATAYNLLGGALQAQQSYDTFVAGYANTSKVTVIITTITGAVGPETNRVGVQLTATQADGSTQRFSGTYDVGAENGGLRIVRASIAAGQ
ncbi:MAG: DUF4232 domain-containing protein [Thermomicrobiales bacterium]